MHPRCANHSGPDADHACRRPAHAPILGAEGILHRVKNQAFLHRIRFAWSGVRVAVARERSLRTQLLCALGILLLLCWLRPAAIWWALCALASGLVLALELVNTALEQALDRLHPEQHESMRVAKDCAAAAVLCASVAAAIVGLLTVLTALGIV